MAIETINKAFPVLSQGKRGQAHLQLGKIGFDVEADEPVFPEIESEEEAIMDAARRWLLENGFRTFGALLADPVKLAEFNTGEKPIRVDR